MPTRSTTRTTTAKRRSSTPARSGCSGWAASCAASSTARAAETPRPCPSTRSYPARRAEMVVEPPGGAAPPVRVRPAPVPSAGAGPTSGARFAIEFGPFMTAPEAERVERQLNEAGYQTVRFRQQTGAALYAVLIEKILGARDAQTLIAALREQGFG